MYDMPVIPRKEERSSQSPLLIYTIYDC